MAKDGSPNMSGNQAIVLIVLIICIAWAARGWFQAIVDTRKAENQRLELLIRSGLTNNLEKVR